MSKLQPALMKSATFRRRMRGVKARSEWRSIMTQREREIAVWDAMPLGLGERALDLGQRPLNMGFNLLALRVAVDWVQRRLSDAIQPKQGISAFRRDLNADREQDPVVRDVSEAFVPQRLRKGRHSSCKFHNLAVLKVQALFKGLHRLLSIGLRCGEEAESPAGANPPPATKRSADE